MSAEDDLTISLPNNEMSRDEVLAQFVAHRRAQGQDTSAVSWAELEATARPLYEAYARDELPMAHIRAALGLDRASTAYVLDEMYGAGKWVILRGRSAPR